MSKTVAAFVLLAAAAGLLISRPAPPARVGQQPDGAFVLHNGWRLTPAGKQIPLSTLPMSTALSPDGKYLLVLNGGYLPPSISVIDVAAERETARVPVEDGWLGLTFNRKGDRVYVGGGSQPFVFEFSFAGGELKPARRFAVMPDPRPTDHVGDVAVSPDGRLLYVASLFRNSIVVLNTYSGFRVSEIPTGRRPYRILFAPDGKTFYVSHWADAGVGEYDAAAASIPERAANARLGTIAVGMHPTDMVYLPGKNEASGDETAFVGRLFVACANTNSVMVLGITDDNQARLIERLNVALAPRAPAGSTPSALALSPDGKWLYVVCSDNNTVAVVDVSEYQAAVQGFIPTAWYPTAVRAMSDGRIFILNGRGRGGFANPAGPNPTVKGGGTSQYVGRMQTGSLSIVPPPGDEQLDAYSRQAVLNSPYNDDKLHDPGVKLPSEIKHALYIVKENRTYDQVLGDLKEGNGDPSLVLFGEQITPNHHKLAREFVLLDNFYVNADVSADGHNWTMAAIANDYVEKMWPSRYGHRRKIYDFEGGEPAAFPPAGYLWTNALSAGLTLRNYGMWVQNNKALTGVERVRDPALAPYTDKNFVTFNLDYPDQKRADEFLREFNEFVKKGALPQLILLRLPNDHTAGTAAGKHTPLALAADNDYALGRIVEAISRSPVWNQIAIFVVEDDAQNGPDHVDSHRSPAFVLSAYSKRGFVDSTHYATVSMLRTMELLLGLRPMTQFDAAATPMANCFAAVPDARPYTAEKPRISLEDRNAAEAPAAAASARMDFSAEDRVDDDALNRILWSAIRGSNPPAATRSYFARAPR
ncbi:MAG TPA: bifunctional YncE family protein/alkaline phosphatase family protein [Bryobacterales bacterium]|nr:bifunctional YncE family protein/alkaline phosphatase family protein [Bryobacterales bacterium]